MNTPASPSHPLNFIKVWPKKRALLKNMVFFNQEVRLRALCRASLSKVFTARADVWMQQFTRVHGKRAIAAQASKTFGVLDFLYLFAGNRWPAA